MTPFVTSLGMPGCKIPLNGSSLLGGSLTLGVSEGKGDCLQAFVNERMVIVQKGDAIVGRSISVIKQRPW